MRYFQVHHFHCSHTSASIKLKSIEADFSHGRHRWRLSLLLLPRLFPDPKDLLVGSYLHGFGTVYGVAWELTAQHRFLHGNSFSGACLHRCLAGSTHLLTACKDVFVRQKYHCPRNSENQVKQNALLAADGIHLNTKNNTVSWPPLWYGYPWKVAPTKPPQTF